MRHLRERPAPGKERSLDRRDTNSWGWDRIARRHLPYPQWLQGEPPPQGEADL